MKEIWSKKIIIPTIIIAALYVVATVYLMNAGLVKDAILGTHLLGYRLNLLMALLAGMWTAMTGIGLTLLIVIAILTGANLTLTVKRLRMMQLSGGVYFVAGGSSLLGIVGSGCASCGLPVLALLGLSGAVAYLPFQGMALSIIALILLLVSLFVLLKNSSRKLACEVESDKPHG